MRPIVLVVASCLATLSACTSGCGIGDGPMASHSDAGHPPEAVRIGEVLSLTGSEATFGISTRNGIQLAVDEANAEGGIRGAPLEIKVLDAGGQADLAAEAARRLIEQEGVKLLLGEIASANSIAMAAVAQAHHVPMVTPSSTSPKVTEGRDYVARVCFIDAFQGFVMAKFARDNLKLDRVAVFREKSEYSAGLADVFARKFTALGGRVVAVESYEKDPATKGPPDFRDALERLRRAAPEAVYVPGYYADVALIARQARASGLDVPLLGGDGWDSKLLYEKGGDAVQGDYFSNHYSPEDPSPRSQKFIAAYQRKFGSVPDSLAALGYDAARVAIQALRRADALDGASVRAALLQTQDFPGVTGNISLDSHRNAVKPAVVLQMVDGRAKYVTTVSP